jgi:hypothetical protein
MAESGMAQQDTPAADSLAAAEDLYSDQAYQ